MSEIRNPPTPTCQEPLTHLPDFVLNRLFPTVEQHRVCIPLEGDFTPDELPSLERIDAPIQAERIVPALLGEDGEGRVGSLGKESHGDGFVAEFDEFGSDLFGDELAGGEGELLVHRGREFVGPRIKDL